MSNAKIDRTGSTTRNGMFCHPGRGGKHSRTRDFVYEDRFERIEARAKPSVSLGAVTSDTVAVLRI